MNPIRRGQNREKWYVTNITNRPITISDLTSVPCIDPNKTVDVLFYETKDKVSTSTVLSSLIRMKWVTMIKHGVDGDTVVTPSTADTALQEGEKDWVANEVVVGIENYTGTIGGGGGGNSSNDNNGGGGCCVPTDPQFTYCYTASVGAGSVITQQSNPILFAYTGKLSGFIVTCNSPFKAYCVMVNSDVESSPFALAYSNDFSWTFTPPSPEYFTVTGSTEGFNGFRMYITNLDVSGSSDICTIFYYDEE